MPTTTIRLFGAAVLAAAATASAADAPQNAKQAYAQAVPQDSLKRMSSADRLLALEEIRQLPLRYGRCISQKDWDCVRNVFTPDFYYDTARGRAVGPEGFIGVMHDAGTYDRVMTVLHMHGSEIEILSPTSARGITAADFTFYYPLGQSFPTTGKEAVQPGQESHTPTYYYQTFEKLDGVWKIKTSDHISFDLRREFREYVKMNDKAFVTPEGVPPTQR